VTLDVTVDTLNPLPGATVVVNITLQVTGSTATGVTVVNTLPSGMTLGGVLDSAGFNYNQAGQVLTWDNATVTAGTVTLSFWVTVDAGVPLGADLTDTVEVTYDVPGGTNTVQDSVTCRVPGATPTPTRTQVAQRTVVDPVETPIAYPNPVEDGETVMVSVPLGEAADSVLLQVFTTAYRKILEEELGAMTAGVHGVALTLRDSKGKPLANGVYYLVVTTEKGKAIGKILIVR
jgi:hypothetical protein